MDVGTLLYVETCALSGSHDLLGDGPDVAKTTSYPGEPRRTVAQRPGWQVGLE